MRSPPQDSWHKAYCIFFLQGIGQLLPWNVFINAEEYFRERFCGSPFDNSFENSFAFGYNLAAIVGVLLALRYQERWDIRSRVMKSLAVSMTAFVLCGVLVLIEGASSMFLFVSTMVLVIMSGVSAAFLQGALFSMASAFPPRYTQAMMVGQGLAGLTVSLVGLFTTLAGPDDTSCILDIDAATTVHPAQPLLQAVDNPSYPSCAPYARDWSTLVYFGVAVAVLFGCFLTYPVLEQLPLTTFYAGAGICHEEAGVTEIIPESDVDGVATDGAADTAGGGRSNGGRGWLGSGRSAVASSSPSSSVYRRLVETPPLQLLPRDKPLSDSAMYERGGGEVQRKENTICSDGEGVATTAANGFRSRLAPISPYAFAVFVAFAVTLSVFPGATSSIVSSRRCQPGRPRFFAGDVFAMFSFVSFNAFDLLGRLAAGLEVVLPNAWLPAASVSRIVFIPLFLACHSEHSRFANWLSADAYPLTIMPVFAFTNGYVSSLSMMAGSQKGAWAGTAMVLFLSSGLLAGSLISFLVLVANAKS